MLTHKNILTSIVIIAMLISCDDKHAVETKAEGKEIPEALEDSKIDMKSYRSSVDLVEELYQELVGSTPELKNLEENLEVLRPKSYELNMKFRKYDSKSNNYYSSANFIANGIKDSLLRVKILSLIGKSTKQYSAKTTEINSLIDQVSKKEITLNDHYAVMKIVLTLPIIEKYQNEARLDAKEFKDLIKDQEKTIGQLDSLTPRY